jgi:hypothetical protein
MYWFKRVLWAFFLFFWLFICWLIVFFFLKPQDNSFIYDFLNKYNPTEYIPENSQQHPGINYQIQFDQKVEKPIGWSEFTSGNPSEIEDYVEKNATYDSSVNNINVSNLGNYSADIYFSSDPTTWEDPNIDNPYGNGRSYEVVGIQISYLVGVLNVVDLVKGGDFEFNPIWDSNDLINPDDPNYDPLNTPLTIRKNDPSTWTLEYHLNDIPTDHRNPLENIIFYSFWINVIYEDTESNQLFMSTDFSGMDRGFVANDNQEYNQNVKIQWKRDNGTFATDYYNGDPTDTRGLLYPEYDEVYFQYQDQTENPVDDISTLDSIVIQILNVNLLSVAYDNNLPDWINDHYDQIISNLNDTLSWVAYVVICFLITFIMALIALIFLFISSSYKSSDSYIEKKNNKQNKE